MCGGGAGGADGGDGGNNGGGGEEGGGSAGGVGGGVGGGGDEGGGGGEGGWYNTLARMWKCTIPMPLCTKQSSYVPTARMAVIWSAASSTPPNVSSTVVGEGCGDGNACTD